jgi:5'-3' exonuclease
VILDIIGGNWSEIFDSLNKIRDEISQFLPYRVLNINGAEADDLIGVISKREHTTKKILILSGDHDFLQLQKYPNIFQYSPTKKHSMISKNPIEDLREFIMCGDRGDGIPNFLSPDDCLVNDIRQTGIRKDHLARWVKESKPENFCDIKMLRGYRRNERLISFDKIPQEIQESILTEWESPFTESRKHLLDYFVKYKLMQMMDRIQEF